MHKSGLIPINFLTQAVPVNAQGILTAPVGLHPFAMAYLALINIGQNVPLPDLTQFSVTGTVPETNKKVVLLPADIVPGKSTNSPKFIFSGDSALGGIVLPLKVADHKYQTRAMPLDVPEMTIVLQTVHSLLAMQAPNGGIYLATQETLDLIKGHPRDISNAHTVTVYKAFQLFLEFLRQSNITAQYMDEVNSINVAMKKIEVYLFKVAFNTETNLFYAGGYFEIPGSEQMTLNLHYATDAQALDLGPDLVDQFLGPQAAYKIWQAIKAQAGQYTDSTLTGIGLVPGTNPYARTTLWAIRVGHRLADFYSSKIGLEIASDVSGLENSFDQFRTTLNGEAVVCAALNMQATWWGGVISNVPDPGATADDILDRIIAFTDTLTVFTAK